MPSRTNIKWWRFTISLILIAGLDLLGAEPLGVPVVAGERDGTSGKRVLELLRSNCVKCHGASDPKAGLRVDRLSVDSQISADATKTWQLILSAVRDNEMPPEKEKQFAADDRDYLVKWIEAGLQRFVELSSTNRPTLRRKLTRIEYQNTMRDLLEIEMDFARDLPADPISSDGFANDSRLLELTPVHLEAYLQCARSALRRVIVSDPRPEEFHHRFERANVSDWHGEAHITSELGRQQQFLAKILTNYPEQGEFLVRVSVEAKLQPNCGFPILEVSVGYQPDTELLFREFPVVEVSAPDGQVYEFKGRIEDFPLPVRGQGKFPGLVVRVRNVYDDGSKMPKGDKGKDNKFTYPAEPHLPVLQVKSVEFHGPIFDTWPPAHHANIITKSEADQKVRRSDIRRILSKFARRAFRRPVTNKEVDSLLKFYNGLKRDFPRVEDAIRETLAFVLIQPDFLFFPAAHAPRSVKTGSRANGDWELASKLSYFLWSSMPDERLFDLAEAGLLKQPKVLRAEVERMLSSPKSLAFLEQFPDRWLSLDLIENVEINREFYPNFNAQLKTDMVGESRALFAEMVRSNRRIEDFLMADFTLLNERLARHYGIPGVYGMKFRQVPIPADQHRGGLLGQAGFLLAGSTGADSHPVRRAVWIRDRLLDDPPPPPPANVPSLDSIDPKFHQLSMREKLQAHRHDPSCASCHRDLDPWGIALENYDAVGLWRREVRTKQGDKMLTSPVVAKDSFSNGSELDGPEALKERLACDNGEQFVRSLMKRLLTYALGRSLELRDQKSVNELEKWIAADGYRMRDMIHRIVSSDLFNKHEHDEKILAP